MKKQHTPGNWSCQKSETSRPESVRLDIVTDAGEYSPAFIAGDALPSDARLIAAAPDLLSALQQMLNADYAIQEGFGEKSDQAILRISAIDSAQRAIAKAKGEV